MAKPHALLHEVSTYIYIYIYIDDGAYGRNTIYLLISTSIFWDFIWLKH